MALGVGPRTEVAGRLDDDVDVQLRPWQRAEIVLAEDSDLVPVDGHDVAVTGDLAGKAPVDRVVLEQLGEHGGIGDVVDGNDVEIGAALERGAQNAAADAAETVDSDASRHGCSPGIEGASHEATKALPARHPRSVRIESP
jgi:hypothetical protein